MANTNLPDKWVRKAIYDAFNGTDVSGNTIEVFDYTVQRKSYPSHFVLLLTQFNEPVDNFCGRSWNHTVQIDVITSFPVNKGNRELADDITNTLLPLLDTLTLDAASSMEVSRISVSFPGDLRESDTNKVYFRKIINVELEIR